MKLKHGLHLDYCTNIHRGETWPETFNSLERHTLAVRGRVCPDQPYAIGLRLSNQASLELSEASRLETFQAWLRDQNCYVFTINGFPYGQFHGTRVKEQVYLPDWTCPERVEYTKRLFDLLAVLLPEDVEGSVSTVPGSFKEMIHSEEQVRQMRRHLWDCVEYLAALKEQTGKTLHLGLEPEPLCYLETSAETVAFLDQMRDDRPGDPRLDTHLGVNYDTCHLAVEFEEPKSVLQRFRQHNVKVSKIHLSSALRVHPTPQVLQNLQSFADGIYFHQVIERGPDGILNRYRDLDVALAQNTRLTRPESIEWRIHFHVPLHSRPTAQFNTTSDHLLDLLHILAKTPGICQHLEMETYTWEVLPPELKNRDVVDQLVAEYDWCLQHLDALDLR